MSGSVTIVIKCLSTVSLQVTRRRGDAVVKNKVAWRLQSTKLTVIYSADVINGTSRMAAELRSRL